MRGTKSKNDRNEKTQSRNHFFRAVRGLNVAEKSKPPKSASRNLTECTYQSITKPHLEGNYVRNELRKLEKPNKKVHFDGLWKCNGAEKSKLPKGTFRTSY